MRARADTKTERRLAAIALVLFLAAAGCAREIDDSSPEGALALFLEAIDRSAHEDPRALEDAYALLDSESQRRLAERARSATALGAREYEPWEMLVDGRAFLRFSPRRGSGLRTRPGATDESAIVVVTGEGSEQRAEVAMRREEDGWRVVLAIPDVRRGGPEPSPSATP